MPVVTAENTAIWVIVSLVPPLVHGPMLAVIVSADPADDCNLRDRLLCGGPTSVQWCPDTQTWMGWLGNCPSLTFGPHWPGANQPEQTR